MKLLPFIIGESNPIENNLVIAADGISKYTNRKIARDHENFKKVIGKHYLVKNKSGEVQPARFSWRKIFTRKFAVHRFDHKNPHAPTIIIKRKHINDQPLYYVKVKMPHPHKEGRFIYHRTTLTNNPSKTLHRMLTEARWSQHTGKQFHRNQHVAVSPGINYRRPFKK